MLVTTAPCALWACGCIFVMIEKVYNRDMLLITQESFQDLLNQAPIRAKAKREVRFASSAAQLSENEWADRELVAVTDRSGNKGILLMYAGPESVYLTSYELSQGITSSNGRAQPIICDFCRTWQTGSRSGSITLARPGRDTGAITFLCCADLLCSRHVRNLTSAAKTSRSQLREDMTNEQRIERLVRRTEEIAHVLGLAPFSV